MLRTEEQMRKLRADSVKESSIESHYTRTAKRYGCKQRKITPFYGPDGWPDRVCIWPDGRGTTDWAELKRPKGGVFQPKQLQIHNELRATGARVDVLATKTAVDAYFRDRAKQLGVKAVANVGRVKRTALMSASEYVSQL